MRRTILMVVILFVLPAQAASDLEAVELEVSGARFSGTMTLMQFFDASPYGSDKAGTPWIKLSATQLSVELYENQGLLVNGFGFDVPELSEEPTETYRFTNGYIYTSAYQAGFMAQALAGAATYDATTTDGTHTATNAVFMGSHGIHAARDGEQGTTSASWFSTVRHDTAHSITSVDDVLMTASGDMEFELTGFLFKVVQGNDTYTLDTRRSTENAAANVDRDTVRFARLVATDAKLELSLSSGMHSFQWAGTGKTTVTATQMTLNGATGAVAGRSLDRERVDLGSATVMTLPGDHLRIEMVTSGQSAIPTAWRSALNMLGIAALVAVPGAVMGARMLRRPVHLDEVENALESGRYRQAARLARRLLKQDPTQEGALISRGIALTKGGEAWQAIDEIHSYLERHTPSDGVIHYVLGAALLDVGNDVQAREAFQVAVERTPQLAGSADEAQAYS